MRVIDNLALKAHEYVISLKGAEIARYELPAGCELAIPVGKSDPPPGGKPTSEPAFGMTGWWIPAEQAERARRSGYTVVDPVSVLGTHLSELIRRYAHELFSRQDAKKMLDRVAVETSQGGGRSGPKAAAARHRAARAAEPAARARVHSRRRHHSGSLGEAAVTTRNPVLLTEYVRQAIRRTW